MLRSLDIRDILIIDRLHLEFQPGLNVLTGETGAGKSILLDALGFVLGWRGRAELVRQGAKQGEVTAIFEIGRDHPVTSILEEAGYEAEGELILRRVNALDGRKSAWVNDRRASGELLRALSDALVELHGQHDDRGLLNPRHHRTLLDVFAGAEAHLGATRAAWRGLAAAQAELQEARAALLAAREEEDFLRHTVSELEAFGPEVGEEDKLDRARRQMQAAERVRDDVAKAYQVLGPDGAEGRMSDALRWLDGAVPEMEGRLDAALAALGRALNELGEAEQAVALCLDEMQVDPGELDRVEERLFALRALGRKHGVLPEALPDLARDAQRKLAAIDGGAQDLADLEQAVTEAAATYDSAAQALSALRASAAGRLDAAMAAELAPLKMERAVFATELSPDAPGPSGSDAVTFTVATNPGAPSGPLNKIASGGELSRFLLALKVCLTSASAGMTMIFDEIDRGVGGATADAVGRRLASLAEGAQVLVVTHSPQVAAQGAHHWQVSKRVEDGMTLSTVQPLDLEARVDEIARMLAGDTITTEARGAARALLGQ